MESQPGHLAKPIRCDDALLLHSLDEGLSETQEASIAQHLTECVLCRQKLETLAAEPHGWSQIGMALRKESSVGLSSKNHFDDDDFDNSTWKPSDFIVDYLQPSIATESLGRLGNIEIREFIGQGAHGIVLKGFQEELNRLVAVKVMAPHLASVVAARKRFSREARATAAILHPNVLPVLHVDSTGPLPYLVMPYIDCESLQDRLDREGILTVADVLRIGLQVGRGLAAAHAQGLVHRDVKPANILLERGVERVMLTDFGLARAVDDATLTRSGFIAGTPHYMSPEQARGDSVDTRSDLFSLGSVFYAMCTGRPPFRAESTFGILRRVTDDAPRPVRELNPDVPSWLEGIVLKLLSKPAGDRIESADELADLMEACLAHVQQPQTIALPLLAKKLDRQSHLIAKSRRLRFVGVSVVLFGLMSLFSALAYFNPFAKVETKTNEIQTLGEADTSSLFREQESAPEPVFEPPWDDNVANSLQSIEFGLDALEGATKMP